MQFKPLFNLQSITIRKAFIINAIVLASIASTSVALSRYLDIRKETKGLTETKKIWLTLLGTFIFGLIIYIVMRIFFGFGEGLLAKRPFSKNLF